jgi:hypothetical protein
VCQQPSQRLACADARALATQFIFTRPYKQRGNTHSNDVRAIHQLGYSLRPARYVCADPCVSMTGSPWRLLHALMPASVSVPEMLYALRFEVVDNMQPGSRSRTYHRRKDHLTPADVPRSAAHQQAQNAHTCVLMNVAQSCTSSLHISQFRQSFDPPRRGPGGHTTFAHFVRSTD